MLGHAVKAVSMGLAIFPVAVNEKVPHRAAGKWGETAACDLQAAVSFWSQEPQANIGVACKPSELLIVDLDKPKAPDILKGTPWAYLHSVYGPYVTGVHLLREMAEKLGGNPDTDFNTYRVLTGSGGMHLYYRWPASWPRTSQASPVKGVIDIRGNGGQYGGYVLGAGSETASGIYYELTPNTPIALPPVWLRTLVQERVYQPKPRKLLRQPGAVSWSGLAASVEGAGDGNRNNALLWAARSMCEEGATEQEALDMLGPAAESAGLGVVEVGRTIRSAYRTQQRKDGT